MEDYDVDDLELEDENDEEEIQDTSDTQELTYAGTVIRNPVKAIRQHCLQCSCYQRDEVKLCPCTSCFLWPFRFGKNPYRVSKKRELTDEQRIALKERLQKARNNK